MSAVAYSSFYSPYYKWFVEMGYPQLDINVWPDGEWAILEMENAPVIPSLTKWKYILTGFRNVEINRSFIKRQVEKIDLQKLEFWEAELAKSEKAEQEQVAKEKHAEDIASRMTSAISQNPDMLNRIAKTGNIRAEIQRLRSRIPNYRF